MKKLILFFIAFIQACSSDGYQKNRDSRLITTPFKEGKSIIITRANVSYEAHNGKGFSADFTEMNWCKDEKNKKCDEIFYQSPYTRKKFHSQYSYYTINPGSYYLEEIKENASRPELWPLLPFVAIIGASPFPDTNYSTSLVGWNNKLNAPNYISFEAKANEITYIGDLYFTVTRQKYWLRGKMNIKVEDNYEQAISFFRKNYPEFRNKKIVKNLAKPGVLLDSFKDGFFW